LIVSFGDKGTEHLYHGEKSKETRKYPKEILRTALHKLDMLNGARELRDLRSPPGNRLEALKGNLQGFFSIRVNSQWRVIFKWEAGRALEVGLVDYH
jgi:toxin HigB-1